MPSQRTESPGSQRAMLAARLDTPDTPAGAPRAWALFACCFTCSKDTKGAAHIARALAAQGFGGQWIGRDPAQTLLSAVNGRAVATPHAQAPDFAAATHQSRHVARHVGGPA